MNRVIKALRRILGIVLINLCAVFLSIVQFLALTKERIRMRLSLMQFSDPQMQLQVVNEIRDELLRKEENRLYENIEQTAIMNQFNRFALAYVNLMAAIVKYYDYPANPDITEKDYKDAPEEFKKAKSQMLTYTRWLIISGVPAFEEVEHALVSVELNSFDNVNDWIDYFEECLVAFELYESTSI